MQDNNERICIKQAENNNSKFEFKRHVTDTSVSIVSKFKDVYKFVHVALYDANNKEMLIIYCTE